METSLYRYWRGAPTLAEVIRSFDDRGYGVFDYGGEYRAAAAQLLVHLDLIFVLKTGGLTRRYGRCV